MEIKLCITDKGHHMQGICCLTAGMIFYLILEHLGEIKKPFSSSRDVSRKSVTWN